MLRMEKVKGRTFAEKIEKEKEKVEEIQLTNLASLGSLASKIRTELGKRLTTLQHRGKHKFVPPIKAGPIDKRT